MIRVLFLFVLITSNGFGITDQQREAFKNGFKTGLEMLSFQINNEGINVKKAEFPKNGYIVYVPIKNTPMADVLYFQYMGNRDGFKTLLSKENLIFGFFNREADAIDSANRIHKLYDITAKITTSSKVFYIYPVLLQEAYLRFIQEAKNEGMNINTDVLVIEKKIPILSKQTKPKVLKKNYFALINPLTQSYFLIGSEKYSKNFQEGSVINGDRKYQFDKKITTEQGEIFFKAKNKNLYFSGDDVQEMEE